MASPVAKKKKFSSADHRQMNNRILRKIWICSDVLLDIFPLFERPQLGLKLALLSPRFNVLVDTHFDGKSELTIWRELTIGKDDGLKPKLSVRIDGKSVPFLLPNFPLHNKIRFNDLRIEYIDHSVIKFLRSNKHIFDKRGISFCFSMDSLTNQCLNWNDVILRQILPIFTPNIRRLDFSDSLPANVLLFDAPIIISNQNINSIESDDFSLYVIGFTGQNASSAGKALSKWLHTPTKDGQPKQLRCKFDNDPLMSIDEWIKKFKQAFLRATSSSACYTIQFNMPKSSQIVPFKLVNERTNEKLTLKKENNWVMKRCKIGQIVQWKDENLNNVSIILKGANCIGPCHRHRTAAKVKYN